MVLLSTPSGPVEIKEGKEEDKYATMTMGVTVSTEDIAGKPIQTEEDANIFASLADVFMGSEYLYNLLKEFIRTNWDRAAQDMSEDKSIAE